LLVARLVQIVTAFRSSAAGMSAEELAEGLEALLWQLIADTGVGARCEVAAGEAEGAPLIEVYVHTGRGVVRGAEVGFSFALGGR
ncbi:MAG: hypothetical protein JRH20_15815, partial [Deltaproteobacteria bacterium]|nr:hypothetical protein [Deltaproteobacteria bacterium]